MSLGIVGLFLCLGSFLWLITKLVSKLLDNPETELLPLNLPLLHPLGLEVVAQTGLLDVVNPVSLALVLKSSPSDTVLGKAAEACETKVLPSLDGLEEVVRHAGCVLPEHSGIIVTQTASDTTGQEGWQGMGCHGATQAEDFVGDGA
ncbi:hypothetical protein HG531_007804 [Fusarium graminearum]|nr:hypothetical protein HG531_007804 [Fusarium graminearum]